MRFGLHVLTGRHEDRLLFDYQIKLARSFGYEDASYTLAVEQLMQRYYRTIIDVTLLNELLLQLFREAILSSDQPPQPLNPRFQVHNDYLEAVNEDVFGRHPSALLELFVLLQQNPQIRGVRAGTIRAVVRNLWLIDEEFRQNPRNHRLFLEILRAPRGVTHELRRMNDYGVLGRYIPAFGRVIGRMQYDLFHAYTVDAHIAVRGQQPAPPRDAASSITSCRWSRRSCSSCPSPRSPTSARCSTTSPRGAAAITPIWARSTPRRSASSRACRATTRAWWPGWSRTICCCR